MLYYPGEQTVAVTQVFGVTVVINTNTLPVVLHTQAVGLVFGVGKINPVLQAVHMPVPSAQVAQFVGHAAQVNDVVL